jgi:hypothetical protein
MRDRVRGSTLLKSLVIGAGACLLAPAFILVPIADGVYGRRGMDPTGIVFVVAGVAIAWIAVRAWSRTRHNPEPGLVGALGRHSIWIMAAGVVFAVYASYRLATGGPPQADATGSAGAGCESMSVDLMMALARDASQVRGLEGFVDRITPRCRIDKWPRAAIDCFATRSHAELGGCLDLLTDAQRAAVPELVERIRTPAP